MINRHFLLLNEDIKVCEKITAHIALNSLKKNRTVCIIDFNGSAKNTFHWISKRTSRISESLDELDLFSTTKEFIKEQSDMSELIYITLRNKSLSQLELQLQELFNNALILVYAEYDLLLASSHELKFLHKTNNLKTSIQFFIVETSEKKQSPFPPTSCIDFFNLKEYHRFL